MSALFIYAQGNMRKSKLTAGEIEAAEKAADDRKTSRGHGFDLMKVRDRGWGRLSNGVTMLWQVDPEKRQDGIAYADIPKGKFILDTGKDKHLYDADDFQKFLRWT